MDINLDIYDVPKKWPSPLHRSTSNSTWVWGCVIPRASEITLKEMDKFSKSSRWRHNERDGVSNYRICIVCSAVCSGADQRKHQSSTSLAFVRGIHRWPVDSPHKGSVTRKIFPFDDVIMYQAQSQQSANYWDILHMIIFDLATKYVMIFWYMFVKTPSVLTWIRSNLLQHDLAKLMNWWHKKNVFCS